MFGDEGKEIARKEKTVIHSFILSQTSIIVQPALCQALSQVLGIR